MQVDFYQLTRDPAEKVLPAIAQRILDNKGRLLIISDDADQLDAISGALWTARADSFLAHAKSGESDDDLQPILLSHDTDAPNGAKFLALADGNWREVTQDFERVFYLFPPEQTDNARSAWRTLGDGVERRYWKQDGGKWVQGP
ncbi:MAG: DNA polymerase III subunit chi [Sphingomonadaceae bacterium]|jgi:DNA polymerase-3 subunit chi|uniref:DNA polymerase III subunit chi n=1 Tax=Sphingorhabdus sp. TaxID=1902408 RepID=UPI0039BCC061|nr:DNA polymerase III subunit chi [Sphingomonadaceae bacterium]